MRTSETGIPGTVASKNEKNAPFKFANDYRWHRFTLISLNCQDKEINVSGRQLSAGGGGGGGGCGGGGGGGGGGGFEVVGRKLMILLNFSKNCTKLKEFGSQSEERARPKFYCVDPPLHIILVLL